MKKKLLIIASIVVLVFAIFVIKNITTHSKIASIANDIGQAYGVSDFKSESNVAWNGITWSITLTSNTFDRLSDEDQCNLMLKIGADSKMKSLLADEIRNYDNPLTYARFVIISNGIGYKIWTNDSEDAIGISGSGRGAHVDGIKEHGYKRVFRNEYGNENTICAHVGCTNTIAYTGDTNCCVEHSNTCGECSCYIDEDAMFCMSCIKSAIG